MKIATFLIAFSGLGLVSSSPVRTQVSPKIPAPTDAISSAGAILPSTSDHHGSQTGASTQILTHENSPDDSEPRVVWEPIESHENNKKMKKNIENACRQALQKLDCKDAIIYAGSHRVSRGGFIKKFFKVLVRNKGDNSDQGRIMRLYDGGEIEFHPDDVLEQSHLHGIDFRRKRQRRPSLVASMTTQAPLEKYTENDAKPRILWEPPDAFTRNSFSFERKVFLGEACRRGLQEEDCKDATIYAGSHREGRDGLLKKFFKVVVRKQGDNLDQGRIMRLYVDGETRFHRNDVLGRGELHGEDFRRRHRKRKRILTTNIPTRPIASTQVLNQEHTENGPKIIWEPPDTYRSQHRHETKKFLEDACRRALQGEGCEKATIYGTLLREQNASVLTRYLSVAVSKKQKDGDADQVRLMRLYRDGTAKWHPKDIHVPNAGVKIVPVASSRHESKSPGEGSSTSIHGVYTGKDHEPGEGEYQPLDVGYWPAHGEENLHYFPIVGSGEHPGESHDLDHLSPGGWWD